MARNRAATLMPMLAPNDRQLAIVMTAAAGLPPDRSSGGGLAAARAWCFRLRSYLVEEMPVARLTEVLESLHFDHNGICRINVDEGTKNFLLHGVFLDRIATRLRVLGFRFADTDLDDAVRLKLFSSLSAPYFRAQRRLNVPFDGSIQSTSHVSISDVV